MRFPLFGLALILIFSCSRKVISSRTFDGKVFQSGKNPAYGGANRFVFNVPNSLFTGQGRQCLCVKESGDIILKWRNMFESE